MFKHATRRNRQSIFVLALAALLALLLATAATAAAENKPAPITITADNAQLSRTAGTSTYTGHVVLERGGMTLTGVKLVVKRMADDTYQATLSGQPATLKRVPQAADAEPVKGHANQIIYTSGNAQIVLRGDAVLHRSGDTIHSAIIRHGLDTRRTTAEGTSQGDGRVTITLHPNKADAQP